MSEGKWLPGKGVFMSLNEEVLDWMKDTMECIWNAAGGEGELNTLIDEGSDQMKEFLRQLRGSSTGWVAEDDDFGIKLYRELEWADSADGTPQKYRVTLVITKPKNNQPPRLKLDIRQWYQATARTSRGSWS